MPVKKPVSKLSDKIAKVDDSFSVNMYDNGFMVEVRGRAFNDEWTTAKIVASNVDELIALIREVISAERD